MAATCLEAGWAIHLCAWGVRSFLCGPQKGELAHGRRSGDERAETIGMYVAHNPLPCGVLVGGWSAAGLRPWAVLD